LEARIGYTFRNPALLELALRHASLADARVNSNERLEFLGDAALGLVVCELIYQKFPHLLEGEMTKIKSTVVSRQTCAEMGRDLGLVEFLLIGKGMKTHAVLPHSLSAAALEALIAALYLDGGLEAVRSFLHPRVEPLIEKAADSGHQENFKSILQQFAQQDMSRTPTYVVLQQQGPDHAKHFQVCVAIGERRFAPAWGPSKKQAEQAAALLALTELNVLQRDDAGKLRIVEPMTKNGKDSNAA
jgi:ribonuclease-3